SVKREARLACDRGGAVRETEAQDQEQPRRAEPDERPPEEKLQRFLQGRHGALHIIETGSSLPAAPGCASKRADRYVYNAQFLERLKPCTSASADQRRESVLVHTNAREGRNGSSRRWVGSRRCG